MRVPEPIRHPSLIEIRYHCRFSITCVDALKCVHLSMGFLMARRAEGDQILGSVIAQSAPRLNVMDLKILHAPARLATPAISLQDFAAELAISFRLKPQPWALGADSFQNVT
jgi:hypothetical protein